MTENTYRIPVFETVGTAWDKIKGAKLTIWVASLISFVIILLLNLVGSTLINITPPIQPAIIAILSVGIAALLIIIMLAEFFLPMGVTYIGIRRAQDLPISIGLMFRTFEGPIAIRIIGVYLLHILLFGLPIIVLLAATAIICQMFGPQQLTPAWTFIAIVIGIILFCILYYFFIRLIFSWAFVLDKTTNPWQAIKLSFAITQSNFWRIIAIFVLGLIIMAILFIPALVSLLLAISYKNLIMGFLVTPALIIITQFWTIPFAYILYGNIYKNLSAQTISAQ